MTILNTVLLTLMAGVMAYDRVSAFLKAKKSSSTISLKKLKKEERDAIDEINKRFSRSFKENVDFFDSF